MEFIRPIFHSLFEGTTVTKSFLKSLICNASYNEVNKLFATFNKKQLGNVKLRP